MGCAGAALMLLAADLEIIFKIAVRGGWGGNTITRAHRAAGSHCCQWVLRKGRVTAANRRWSCVRARDGGRVYSLRRSAARGSRPRGEDRCWCARHNGRLTPNILRVRKSSSQHQYMGKIRREILAGTHRQRVSSPAACEWMIPTSGSERRRGWPQPSCGCLRDASPRHPDRSQHRESRSRGVRSSSFHDADG